MTVIFAVLSFVICDDPAVRFETKLIGSMAQPDDNIGSTICLSGSYIFLGGFNENGTRRGVVYVFCKDSSWKEIQQITAPYARDGDGFGISLASDGDYLAIGSTPHVSARNLQGEVHMFRREGRWWRYEATLVADADEKGDGPPKRRGTQASPRDYFGWSVVIRGNVVVVGAPERNGRGAVYVFVKTQAGWEKSQVFEEPLELNSDFGWSLAFDGRFVVVGAPGTNGGTGGVYIYKNSGSKWELSDRLVGTQMSAFGSSVSLGSQVIAVGAPRSSAEKIVVLYHDMNERWIPKDTLRSVDDNSHVEFGSSVAFGDGRIAVGCDGELSRNPVYVFERKEDAWRVVCKISRPRDEGGRRFGTPVTIQEDLLLVGAAWDTKEKRGAAYLFNLLSQENNCK